MICHLSKCIFFHVPRTGGTSIENLLGYELDPRVTNRDIFFGYDPSLGLYLQHCSCSYVKEHIISEKIFNGYFKFAVVREPYSRLLSCYHLVRDNGFTSQSLEEYVLGLRPRASSAVATIGTFESPQHYFTHIEQEQVVDFVGRFEELPETIEILREKLQIERPFCHLNRGSRSWSQERPEKYFTRAMLDVVNEVYAEDFRLFNYPTL